MIMYNLLTKRLFNCNTLSHEVSTCRRFLATFSSKKGMKKKYLKRQRIPVLADSFTKLSPIVDRKPVQIFDYFLVLDFEATCNSPVNLDPQEIIEFPVLKVNSRSFEVESSFHSFVKPEVYPHLTSFCTELTGITQEMVQSEPVFKDVFNNFLVWLKKEDLLHPNLRLGCATCGDIDLSHMFPLQCKLSGCTVPEYMKKWINVKRSFCDISPYTWPDNLMAMLKYCELEHVGELHSGIDDAKNLARVMENLASRGLIFKHNGWAT